VRGQQGVRVRPSRGSLDQSLDELKLAVNYMRTDTAKRIADLNDFCRTSMGEPGLVFQTNGIWDLPFWLQSKIRERIQIFNAFSPVNDPRGLHKSGALECYGTTVLWEVEYCDSNMYQTGTEDASDPTTTRVLVISLASDRRVN